jgi:hypothetical protein
MQKLTCLLCATLLVALTCHGQDRSYVFLHGSVLDDSTGEALSYATIAGPRNAVNSLSNETGRFLLKLKDAGPGDSMTITHVGYQGIRIPVLDVKNIAPRDKDLVIRLRRKPIQLSEAVVNGIGPLDIIKKAIARIPDNYSESPYELEGFYRLTGRNKGRIVELSEAVFDIFGADYQTGNQQFHLIKSRLDQDWSVFGGNHLSIIRRPQGVINSDMVGNVQESEILGDQQRPEHVYFYRGIVDYEGQTAYRIDYDQKPDLKKADHRGTILIDTQTYAFLSITRALSPLGLRYWHLKSQLDQRALDHLQLTQTSLADSVVITYQRYGARYYMHHYYRLWAVRLSGGIYRTIDLNPLITETNCLITRIDTVGVHPFADEDVLASESAIERHADDSERGDRFWENYNDIEADFDVDSAAAVIRRHNR